MSCVLGTTERRVRWYQETSADGNENVKFVLHDVLDLDSVSSWGTKEAAKLGMLTKQPNHRRPSSTSRR